MRAARASRAGAPMMRMTAARTRRSSESPEVDAERQKVEVLGVA